MTKLLLFAIVFLIGLVLFILYKTKCKELKELKSDYKRAVEYGNKMAKAYEEASAKKQRLNTGNDLDDFANSINILHEYTTRNTKSKY